MGVKCMSSMCNRYKNKMATQLPHVTILFVIYVDMLLTFYSMTAD